MNDDQLNKQIDTIQANLRQTRAEVVALHTRMGIIEHRLNQIDVRVVEVPLGISDLKLHLDQRIDALGKQLDDIAAALRELSPGRSD
jgi:hypothetical protein